MQNEDLTRSLLLPAFDRAPDQATLQLANLIAQRNIARKATIKDMALGEPIWDVFLDIYLAEKFDLRASIDVISERTQTSVATCLRCVDYLLASLKIVENGDQHSVFKQPFVLSAEASQQLSDWLRSWFEDTDARTVSALSG